MKISSEAVLERLEESKFKAQTIEKVICKLILLKSEDPLAMGKKKRTYYENGMPVAHEYETGEIINISN